MEEEKNIVPEQKKEEPKNKGNGLLITILLIVILALAGYIVYDKVIKKDNPEEKIEEKEKKEEQQEEETKEETKQEEVKEEKFSLDNLAGKTFKTKDGKKKLEIVSKKDSKAVNEAEKYEFIDLNGDFDYFGYYNGVLFTIYKNAEFSNNKQSKYVLLGGREKGNVPQCSETHEFVINTEDNTLVNLKYDSPEGGGYHYIISKYGDNIYFSEGGCAMSFMSENVYDEKLNRIGDVILGSEKDNFYVANGYIVKYDKNAKILKQTTNKYESNKIYNNTEVEYAKPIVTSNNLYFIYEDYKKEDSDFILVDVMNDKEYNLAPSADYIMKKFAIDKTNSLITINFDLNTEMCKKCDGDQLVSYTYDVVNKTITKN